MQKIIPHLWYDKEAKEAAEFYTSVFKGLFGSTHGSSDIKNVTTLEGTPSDSVDIVNFELCGYEFSAISAGPIFKFTPAISFLVGCDTKEEVDKLWAKLSEGGMALMELGTYPFSEKYGWLQDKYGLSWQIMFTGGFELKHKIIPTLMFVGDVCGRAEEAMQFYASIFHDSKLGEMLRYTKGEEPDKEGTVKHAALTLEGQEFAVMDSSHKHAFNFNEAISLMVSCKDQKEIDDYWEKLSAVPESEQCGWLKDKFGVSWQIVPSNMNEMMEKGSKEQIARLTESFLKMKKFDLAELERVYEGR